MTKTKIRAGWQEDVTIIKCLDEIADTQGSSRSDVIRVAVRNHINNMIKETASQVENR